MLVRAGSALGRAGWLSVTYGTPDQNARFLRALGEILRDESGEPAPSARGRADRP